MSPDRGSLGGALRTWVRRLLQRRTYRGNLRRGQPAGEQTWVFDASAPAVPALVELRLPAFGANAVSRSAAAAWCSRQTLAELRAVGFGPGGEEAWRVNGADDHGEPAPYFAAPGALPDALPAHLETCLLILAAEAIDAVVLRERVLPPVGTAADGRRVVSDPGLRAWAVYRSGSYRYQAEDDDVRPVREELLVKLIDTDGVGDLPRERGLWHATRRGSYLGTTELGPVLEVGVRDAALLRRRPSSAGSRIPVLVTVPFLARGGAEHTLLETMRVLADRFDFSIATLAPHRSALGDRRDDFRAVTERLYCLGDTVHPAAMVGMLNAILDATGAQILYNANGTTLFYDFAPQLKATRPSLRIVDHLYDHRIGYIDRYTPELQQSVDACVAENRRIAEVLVGDQGWTRERVPVVFPCGRPRDAFPPPDRRAEVRRTLRAELGLRAEDVVFLTAARMHAQKRPLDLVALAGRVRDLEHVHFLVVGGGDMEAEVDTAIATARANRIRRLPFRTDIPDLVVACDVGCLVSDYEGLPVFMLECLQAGRPFLGTAVGDMGEVLRASGAGVVVDRPGDLPALEAAVRQLADPAEWALMAERAIDAAANFEVEHCADRYAAALLGEPLSEPTLGT